MAYKDFSDLSTSNPSHPQTVLNNDGHTVELPDSSYVRDAAMTRDGMDLILDGQKGEMVIHDYFAGENQPTLVAPDGTTLTPDLVNSFAKSPAHYAANTTMSDESPVGSVEEVTGHATVTHPDGTSETIAKGTSIYQGDVIETDAQGAVNIAFIDGTSFAVSQDARLAIDEYVYDPQTQSGSNDFSVLKGVFVYTSGLIGRDDPDSVQIKTPVGSIGIRGTIIAGNVNTGEITVVEGAIVLTDHDGHEMTLATQFETARFHPGEGIENMGQMNAQDLGNKFFIVSQVSPSLFSSINDASLEQETSEETAPAEAEEILEVAPEETLPEQIEGEKQSGDPIMGEEPVAMLPPVPPPTMQLNGFTDTSGFETQSFETASSMTTIETVLAESGGTQLSAGDFLMPIAGDPMLEPQPLPEDPNSLLPPAPDTNLPPPTNGGTTNAAPFYRPEAPQQFFMSSEAQTWHYRFDKEFRDDGGHSNLTYALSTSTINQLNALMNDGVGANIDVLTSGGWNFNATTGELNLNFNTAFQTTPGTASTFSLDVSAIDSQGISTVHSYGFSAFNATVTSITGTYSTDAMIVSAPSFNGTINSDNSKFFLGDGNDSFIIDSDASTNTGSNNLFNLGDGNNFVTINNGTSGNQIVGGDNVDTIVLNTAAIKVFGMDGSDDFKIVLDGSSTVIADLSTAGSNTLIDGGHSNFRAGLVVDATNQVNHLIGEAGGRGDSLILEGTGALNFGLINANNEITSIERLDMETSTAGQSVILSLNDVIKITDDKKALIINVGAGDSINLTGMSGMAKVLDNILIDDNQTATGTTVDDKSYDVFTDGNVTLLVHSAGGTVQFDGSNVAI
ncbi:MAG: FecR domain-containing protein [Alphaproteobacteria bacterium]